VLNKINRISKKKEFQEIKEKGFVYQSPFFGFAVLKKDDDKKCFGFIISKKISKRAVDRNRIKRLLAEAVRQNLDKFQNGFRGVFLVKKNILGIDFETIKKELINLNEKISS
jgi:ribonuclease P protein component